MYIPKSNNIIQQIFKNHFNEFENIYEEKYADEYGSFNIIRNIEDKIPGKSWEMEEKGFWRDIPYLSLSESFHYPENKVILNQHIVMEKSGNHEIYRFWTHYFNHDDIVSILEPKGLRVLGGHDHILPEVDTWSNKDITFYEAIKKN